MREGHLYKCGSLKPWRSNPHEKGHPTGLLALVKHQAFPWLTCGANPLSLDLSLFSQLSYTDVVILLVCKSNLDILRKDKLSLRGFFCMSTVFSVLSPVFQVEEFAPRTHAGNAGSFLPLGLDYVPAPISKQLCYAIKRESMPSPLA